MSTIFAVRLGEYKNATFQDVEVAFRTNSHVGSRFTNPLAHLLPDDTPLIAIDNTQQGVYNIGDFKKLIKNN